MLDSSFNILEIVWEITELFFLISVIFLIILFIIHKIMDNKSIYFKQKEIEYSNLGLNNRVKLSNETDIIAYSHIIGLKLLKTSNRVERKQIEDIINNLNLYNKIFNIYTLKSAIQTRLYIFSILALLAEHKGREFYISILYEKNKKNQYMIEFTRWSLLALAISSKSYKDLNELYEILQDLNKKIFITQKLYQFFLVEAFCTIEEKELIIFLKNFKPKSINYISTAVIYALQSCKYNKNLHNALIDIYKNYTQEPQMIVSILRTLDSWKCQEEDMILKYHNHENDLIRIVCAKIGLDMINESKFPILYHYLFDSNSYVRKNFIVALSKYQIPSYEIMYDIEKIYPDYIENPLLHSSIIQYKIGIG